jgi:hypothetical protein
MRIGRAVVRFAGLMRRAGRIGLLAVAGTAACGGIGGELLRQYEYEEDMYLSLDGGATIYVNGSIPALVALRGASFDPSPTARIDRAEIREYYSSPVTRVTRVSLTRRRNRRFAHVRLEVDDVRRLGEAEAFAWSRYRFEEDAGALVYAQVVGPPPEAKPTPALDAVRWTGEELVAFRVHIPSRVEYHNAGPGNLKRGNILVWEQRLADRLRGMPLALDARMQTESILYRTLWLFAASLAAAAALFGAVIVWVVRRGKRES